MKYKIKVFPEDFTVDEILSDGSLASSPVANNIDNAPFVWIALKKKNWNTLDLSREIAKRIKIADKRVNYAGIKDRSAIAYQVFSLNTNKRLDEVCEKINSIKDVEVIDRWRSGRWIKSRDIIGNRFAIVLRNCNFSAADLLSKQISSLFPNYFGEQRFGSVRKNTADVGLSILKGDYRTALNDYFRNYDEMGMRERAMYSRSQKLGAERFIKLNWRLFKFCVHAFQSLIFNRELEMRISDGETGTLEGEYRCGRNRFGFADVDAEGNEFTSTQLVGGNTSVLNSYKEQILSEYEIGTDEFSNAGVKGGWRVLFAPVLNFDAVDAEDENAVKLSFMLQRGSYATVFIRELVSHRPLA